MPERPAAAIDLKLASHLSGTLGNTFRSNAAAVFTPGTFFCAKYATASASCCDLRLGMPDESSFPSDP